MTTTRALRTDVQNALDFLVDAGLAIYANVVAMSDTHVGWHSGSGHGFLVTHDHPDIDQFAAWVEGGQYSAVLFDGSLIQISYGVQGREVTSHRLAFIPFPYRVDRRYIDEGLPFVEILESYRGGDALMQSPLRFDFDLAAAREGHPASHLTLNTSNCRIECVAPVHVLRFLDFVFRHFYTDLWQAHRDFFSAAAWRHVESPRFEVQERSSIHLNWDLNATQSLVSGSHPMADD